jgi:hypothetical protein
MTLRPVTLLLALLLTTSCVRRGEYVVENTTDVRINDVRVIIGKEHDFPHGILIPRSHSGFGGSIPGSGTLPVEISWIVPSGQRLTNRTSVGSKAFTVEDNVYFLITSNGIVTRIKS